MSTARPRGQRITLHLGADEARRWDHMRRSLSDGEVVPSHRQALLMLLDLAEEASAGRLGRLTEAWRNREMEVVEE